MYICSFAEHSNINIIAVYICISFMIHKHINICTLILYSCTQNKHTDTQLQREHTYNDTTSYKHNTHTT